MHPADALDRIVYLLDRALAETTKVRAFARARDVLQDVGDDEVAKLHATGKLTELAGIGPTTARVIGEALDGEVPSYLVHLEDETIIPLGEGADLRAALKGDCHTHSTWSDGGASIESMARTAIALGHDYMVLTDHSPRLTVAHGLSADRLRAQLDEVFALNERLAPFRILTGIEVDILVDGALDQRDDLLARLDVVVASVHSKLRMERSEMTRRMVNAVASPHVDILGHCTGRKLVGSGRPPSQFDAEIVFAACAQFDTALEINCRPERQDPPDELLELAIDWGLRFAVDTDAHAPGQMEWQVYGCDKAARHGIEPERIVNTMAADDLVEWAATHAV
ncbi:MAG TPA: PHP domain-containing protein [Acidimicrobiales bacterium]|nr:PHP domain-containing protein [Acidimicrobiales bacterium]